MKLITFMLISFITYLFNLPSKEIKLYKINDKDRNFAIGLNVYRYITKVCPRELCNDVLCFEESYLPKKICINNN